MVTPEIASEGHVYAGDIAGGAWVDAQHLKPGDELLGIAGNWQRVVDVNAVGTPLLAFNLTVDEYSSYFVTADPSTTPVWVHNHCGNRLPEGFDSIGEMTEYGQTIYHGPNGTTLYRGHDGNYYNPNIVRPTPYGPLNVSSGNYVPVHGADEGFALDCRLPERISGPTNGVVDINGEEIHLRSGAAGPANRWYDPSKPAINQTATHVEGHVAALMVDSGVMDMTVTINNINGPCGVCRSQIPQYLPEGAVLNVRWVDKDGVIKISQIHGRAIKED